MDLNLTASETEFRDGLRTWLAANLKPNWRDELAKCEGQPYGQLTKDAPGVIDERTLGEAQYEVAENEPLDFGCSCLDGIAARAKEAVAPLALITFSNSKMILKPKFDSTAAAVINETAEGQFKKKYLPAIAAGELIATFALARNFVPDAAMAGLILKRKPTASTLIRAASRPPRCRYST